MGDQWSYMRGAEFQGRLMLIGGYLSRRISRESTVLDLNCGHGLILDYLPQCNYLGNDIDVEIIRDNWERYCGRGQTVFTRGSDEFIASEYMGAVDVLLSLGYACGYSDAESPTLEGSVKRIVADKEPETVVLEGWSSCLSTGFDALVEWIARRGYAQPFPRWEVLPVPMGDHRADRLIVMLERT